MKINNFITIFFHNLSDYVSHLFIKDLRYEKDHVNVIEQTTMKYIAFSEDIQILFQPESVVAADIGTNSISLNY